MTEQLHFGLLGPKNIIAISNTKKKKVNPIIKISSGLKVFLVKNF